MVGASSQSFGRVLVLALQITLNKAILLGNFMAKVIVFLFHSSVL